MPATLRRHSAAAVAVLTAAGAMVMPAVAHAQPAATAHAQPVERGTFEMSGDPGDYITGGRSYTYDVADGDTLTVTAATDRRSIRVSIDAANGDWWSLDLAAPQGEQLQPGAYPRATRYPFHGAGAGLSVSGNGRGCNTLTGDFTIDAVTFGPNGYVERLDARFEQHCEGGDAALRGRVSIANPPAPPELGITVSNNPAGTVNRVTGRATVHGTVTCTADVPVNVSGELTQVTRRVIIRGSYTTTVACTSGTAVAWAGVATPAGTTPFGRGLAEAETTASATDPVYGRPVTHSVTSTITLTRP